MPYNNKNRLRKKIHISWQNALKRIDVKKIRGKIYGSRQCSWTVLWNM